MAAGVATTLEGMSWMVRGTAMAVGVVAAVVAAFQIEEEEDLEAQMRMSRRIMRRMSSA